MNRLSVTVFVCHLLSAVCWLLAGIHAYEIGSYLTAFGLAQLVLAFVLSPKAQNRLILVLLTLMQLLPLTLYSFAGAYDGVLVCILSFACLLFGSFRLLSLREA